MIRNYSINNEPLNFCLYKDLFNVLCYCNCDISCPPPVNGSKEIYTGACTYSILFVSLSKITLFKPFPKKKDYLNEYSIQKNDISFMLTLYSNISLYALVLKYYEYTFFIFQCHDVEKHH